MVAHSKTPSKLSFRNRKASFNYELTDTFTAGICLLGSEIKSIRAGHVNVNDCYCLFNKNELFVRNLYIAEYANGGYANHAARRDRKLLLKKRELNKLAKAVKEKTLTIVPTNLFVSNKGLAKLDIALARGKKLYDKRETIKNTENKRILQRLVKGQ